MKRREFILAGSAVALPAFPVRSSSATDNLDRTHLVQIIEQLENYQGWESSCVIAAKCFAAWQFREALLLPLGNSKYPQMHIDFQHDNFERYQRTVWAERDRENGTVFQITPMERELL